MNSHYPASPVGVPKEYTHPSPAFKKGVRKVVLALLLFGIIYIVMLAVGVVMAIVLAILGVWIIFEMHNFLALVAGAGLMLTGILVLYFLVKFIFENKKDARSNNLEIFEDEYPELFAFIRQLSIDTETHFPKHIYISAEVNAAVFYDSNFLSMFFPVRKNLLIGLGVVNSVNVSEFKAVIAHEFGHFSQKSMRAGTYVYQANRVIYNMLYENESYGRLLNSIASIHGIFALCATFIVRLVYGIQWVQQQAYKIVNKQYYGLARQMEYHADAVSAATCGSNNSIHALRRIEFGEDCYQNVLQKYNEWLPENLKGENIYEHQRLVSECLTSEYRLAQQHGLPVLYTTDNWNKGYARVRIDDQWASHPTMQQREDALQKIMVEGEVNNESAWVLFRNAKALQEQFTNKLYSTVKFKGQAIPAGSDVFIQKYKAERNTYNYPEVYGRYYAQRRMTLFDPYERYDDSKEAITDIAAFYTTNTDLNNKSACLMTDINLLNQVAANPASVRYFIFDEQQYKSKYAATISADLQSELQQVQETIKTNDIIASRYFLSLARNKSEETLSSLQNYYDYYSRLVTLCDDNLHASNVLVDILRQLYSMNEASDEARSVTRNLKAATDLFINRINNYTAFLATDTIPYKYSLSETLVKKKDKALTFSGNSQLSATVLDGIYNYVNEFAAWTLELNFKCQKDLLEKQASLLLHNNN